MLDKTGFLEEYHLEDAYQRSGLDWNVLEEIYNDYADNHYEDLQKIACELVNVLEERKNKLSDSERAKVHAIYGRAKEPKHLIEKIIRKVGLENSAKYQKIDKYNYTDIVRDLIGIRILVLAKEHWSAVDDLVRSHFQKFEETPVAYVCYGDRELFDPERLYVDYTTKGYRSQHYIVRYKDCFAEIQARTLAEEVYGEFDHRVRYPYRVSNKFLKRYSSIISKNSAQLDDLISTCLEINEPVLEQLEQNFEEDRYIEWSKKQAVLNYEVDGSDTSKSDEKINDAKEMVYRKIILREGH